MASDSSSTTILSLPVELQQDIVSKTDKRDVLAIRLACRELSAAADDHFLVTFYSERKHLMTRHGIQALIDISGDARLCSKLEKIEIVAVDVDEKINPSYEWPFMSIGTTPSDGRPEEEILRQKLEEQRRKALEAVVWENWTALRDELLDEGWIIVSLLSTAFCHLSTLGCKVSLQISRDTDEPYFAFGCQHFTKYLTGSPMKTGFTVPYLDRCKSLDAPLNLVLQAVTRAELPLSGLCIGDGVFDLDDRARSTFAPFFCVSASNIWPQICAHNLQCVKLNLEWHLWVEGGKKGLALFTEFMQAARGLETVEMDFHFHAEVSVEYRYLSAIGNAFSKSKLRRVLIRDLACYTHELQHFLAQHRESLRSLELGFVAIPKPERWPDMFCWMSSELHLENLFIENVCHGDYNEELIGLVGTRYAKPRHFFADPDAVVTGLHNLAQNAKFGPFDSDPSANESDDSQGDYEDEGERIEKEAFTEVSEEAMPRQRAAGSAVVP